MRVANASTTSTRFNGHVIRAGLNYHLDWGLPSSTDALVAAEQPALGDWQFRFAPYAWAIGLNGDLTMRGRSVDTNVSFYDVLTKSNHLLAWMSYFEARNGPFSFYGDILWARLGFFGGALRQTNPIGISALTIDANANIRSTLAIGEAWMGYELARWRHSGGGDSFTAIDAYGGLRYWYLSNTLSLSVTGAINLPLLGLDFDGKRALAKTGSTQWIDPIFGLRLRHQIRPGDEFQLRGDIGGLWRGQQIQLAVVWRLQPRLQNLRLDHYQRRRVSRFVRRLLQRKRQCAKRHRCDHSWSGHSNELSFLAETWNSGWTCSVAQGEA